MVAFVRAANPIWSFVNLEGLQLDDTYYISYLSNVFPYVPSLVYRSSVVIPPALTPVPWPDPIRFLANGTLPDNIFFEDDLVYRLEIRKGPSQSDPLIYVINDFVPGQTSSPTSEPNTEEENQISNPQFSLVNFEAISPATNPSITFTSAGTYEVAPGWSLVLTGAGTCIVTQHIESGDQNQLANPVPPYYLEFNTNGWTTAILQQRLQGNGGLWTREWLAVSILARSNDAFVRPISVAYHPSVGINTPIIVAVPLTLAVFTVIQKVVQIEQSSNSDSNDIAYVDIQITLPPTGITDISNIQASAQINKPPSTDLFDVSPEETIERQIDHLFHYYKPQLAFKPIPSWLIGWDFPLNPAQFGDTQAASAIGANKSKYVWDQTIIFQSANSGVGITRGTEGQIILTAAATTQAAIIQYLGPQEAREILASPFALNILAGIPIGQATIQGTVSVYFTTDASLPNVASGTNNSIVATLDSRGKPATFNGNWTEVPRINGQNAEFVLQPSTLTNSHLDYNFTGWDLDDDITAATANFIAIVVGTSSILSTHVMGVVSISLCSGEIATRPAPQANSDVFRACQFYYEQSYNNKTVPGTNTALGVRYAPFVIYNIATASVLYLRQFEILFDQVKRNTPIVTFWSKDGTVNDVQVGIRTATAYDAITAGTNPQNIAVSNWNIIQVSQSNAVYLPNTAASIMTLVTPQQAAEGELLFHYVADARLGIT